MRTSFALETLNNPPPKIDFAPQGGILRNEKAAAFMDTRAQDQEAHQADAPANRVE
jgi:hypothetical protein